MCSESEGSGINHITPGGSKKQLVLGDKIGFTTLKGIGFGFVEVRVYTERVEG